MSRNLHIVQRFLREWFPGAGDEPVEEAVRTFCGLKVRRSEAAAVIPEMEGERLCLQCLAAQQREHDDVQYDLSRSMEALLAASARRAGRGESAPPPNVLGTIECPLCDAGVLVPVSYSPTAREGQIKARVVCRPETPPLGEANCGSFFMIDAAAAILDRAWPGRRQGA